MKEDRESSAVDRIEQARGEAQQAEEEFLVTKLEEAMESGDAELQYVLEALLRKETPIEFVIEILPVNYEDQDQDFEQDQVQEKELDEVDSASGIIDDDLVDNSLVEEL